MKSFQERDPDLSKTLVSSRDLWEEFQGSSTLRIIDASNSNDFERLHIPGALNIPFIWEYRGLQTEGGMDAMIALLQRQLQARGITGAEDIVFTEQSPALGFGRSARGLLMSEAAGIPLQKLRLLDGGNLQWKRMGAPTANGIWKYETTSLWDPRENQSSRLLTLEKTLQSLYQGIKFLDVRNEPEFFGHSGAPYQLFEGDPAREVSIEAGRIPGAIGFPWTDVFELTGSRAGCFRSTDELSNLFEGIGLTREEPIVVYCFKGARASAVTLALHLAGFSKSVMYFNGWNEWSRIEDTPKEIGLPTVGQKRGSYQNKM